MRTKKISYYFDSILYMFLLAVATFLLCRYFADTLVSLLVAATTTLGVTYIYRTYRTQKNAYKPTTKELQHISDVLNQFAYNDDLFSLEFFQSALSKYYRAEIITSGILITPIVSSSEDADFGDKNASSTALSIGTITSSDSANSDSINSDKDKLPPLTLVIPYLKLTKITPLEFSNMYAQSNRHHADRILILSLDGATSTTLTTINSIDNKKITLLSSMEVYKLLEELDAFPAVKIIIRPKKRSIKEIFGTCISKKNTKKYLLACIFILLTSYFIKLSIYYVIIASFLLVMSLLCAFKRSTAKS